MSNTLSFDTDLLRMAVAPHLSSAAKVLSEAAVTVKSAANSCPSGFAAGSTLPSLAAQIGNLATLVMEIKNNILAKADALDNAENNNLDLANFLPMIYNDTLDDNSLHKLLMNDNEKEYINWFFNSDAYKDLCKNASDTLANYTDKNSNDAYNILDSYIKDSGDLTTSFSKILGLVDIIYKLEGQDTAFISTLDTSIEVTLPLRDAYILVGDKIHNDRLYIDANGKVTSDWEYYIDHNKGLFYSRDLENCSYLDALNNPNKVTSCGTDPIITLGLIGYLSVADMTFFTSNNKQSFNPNMHTGFDALLRENGCEKITGIQFSAENAAKLEDGDIVFFCYGGDSSADHVQTYRGLSEDGYAMFTNAGSTTAIQSVAPSKSGLYWYCDTKQCNDPSDLQIWAYRLPDEDVTINSNLLPDNYQDCVTDYSENTIINMDSIISSVDAKVSSNTSISGVSNTTNSTSSSSISNSTNSNSPKNDSTDENQFATNLSAN